MTQRRGSGPGGEQPPGPLPVPGSQRASEPAPGAGPAGTTAPLPAEYAEAARTLFGDRLAIAQAYADLLVTEGVLRGLLGPRETSRIWDRHLLNCAVVAELIPTGSSVVDVGSGAGLPGLVLAIARPDLKVVLVEPLARRAAFLTEAITALDLGRSVAVVRARAEELARTRRSAPGRRSGRRHVERGGRTDAGEPVGVGVPDAGAELGLPAEIVTARAVAPLDRLAGWCLPLTAPGGRILALKGASAADEVAQHTAAVLRIGGSQPVIRRCGAGTVEPPTTVVEIVRVRAGGAERPRPGGPRSAGPAGRGRPGRR